MTEAREVAERALAAATGDEVEVVVQGERSGLARFAGSEVHQPTLIENLVCTLRVCRGGKVGTAVTNRLGDEGLAELARRAGEAADSARADEAFPGFAEPASLPEVEAYDEATARLTPEEQARAAGAAIEAAGETGVYGFFTSGVTELAIVSSKGVSAEQSLTDATALVIAAGEDFSGYAEQSAWRVSEIEPAAVAREAVEIAERTRGADELPPGRYRAVLEPYAVAALVTYASFDSFGALGLEEERSFFSGRLGERVLDPKLSIADDGLDPRGLPKAFDFEGMPKQRVELVSEGVLRDVVWDRATAARAGDGRRTTGHALPARLRDAYGPLPLSLSVAGGEAESLDELAELVGDGIYVTRLHYLGVVNPREGVITGMTRDGTFRIRAGKVAEPLVNLRFTVAVPDLLADVPGLTSGVSLVNQSDFYDERYPTGVLAPALATARFDVTGSGSSPGL